MTAIIDVQHFKTRLVTNGPWVPIRTWTEDGEREPETGDLMSDQVERAVLGDKDVDPYKLTDAKWPIDRAEYDYLIALGRWAVKHDPRHPAANPGKSADLSKMEPVF